MRRFSVATVSGPTYETRIQYASDLRVTVANDGVLGLPYPFPWKDMQLLGLDFPPWVEYPSGTGFNYLYLVSMPIAGIKGADTLISEGHSEFFASEVRFNEFTSYDTIVESSDIPTSPFFESRALADQEYYAVYSDTSVFRIGDQTDETDARRHRPIGLEIHQNSYAWSSPSAASLIIVDAWIKNISSHNIEDGAVGVLVIPLIWHWESGSQGGFSTPPFLTGFLHEVPGEQSELPDTLNVAWSASPDGAPAAGVFGPDSPRGVIGIRILRGPPGGRLNYNWWVWVNPDATVSWGPGRRENPRSYGGSFGMPRGDRARYKMMTNGEIDYDQVYAAIDRTGDGWHPPFADRRLIRRAAGGGYSRYLLSWGPCDEIAPGDSVPFTYAIIAGADFHQNPRNWVDNFDPDDPQEFVANLDFSDLINNARLADWTFDNPGVDTDGDGYRGRFHLVDCTEDGVCDTVWYKGDGVPDFTPLNATLPPPAIDVTTSPNRIQIRWTGKLSETAKSALSQRRNFEGYRVYTSRFDIVDQYALVSSWDKANFTRWAHQPASNEWKQISHPLTMDEWRVALGDPGFDPINYEHPSFHTGYRDSVLDTLRNVQGEITSTKWRERYSYWAKEGPNQANQYWQGETWETNPIQRIGEETTIVGEDTVEYGVYECVLDNLNPSIPLYVGVTVFDHGDYRRGIVPVESSPSSNRHYAVPVHSSDVVVDSGLKVTVYPNPYKSRFKDTFGNWTNYFGQGYEAPGKEQLSDRDRRIFFINLPEEATIRIFSLDGDLIREIHHPDPFLTTYSSIVGWDLISRNTQLVESGIYLWRVDSRLGSQVGKLVIIR